MAVKNSRTAFAITSTSQAFPWRFVLASLFMTSFACAACFSFVAAFRCAYSVFVHWCRCQLTRLVRAERSESTWQLQLGLKRERGILNHWFLSFRTDITDNTFDVGNAGNTGTFGPYAHKESERRRVDLGSHLWAALART